MTPQVRVRHVAEFDADDRLGAGIVDCWLEVSNAGGAVGFPFPPVAREQVRDATVRLAGAAASGAIRMFVAEADNEVLGWVVLRLNASPLTSHWAGVERLQCRPDRQGEGIGTLLLTALCDDAGALGLEHLRLVLRSGEGLEAFYESLGWDEIGRHRGALRLAGGDDRDEVAMSLHLSADAHQ